MPDNNLIFPTPPSDGAPQSPPPGSTPPEPRRPTDRSWARMKARANSISGVITLLLSVLVVGGAIGWSLSLFRSSKAPSNGPAITTLSQDDIKKLTDIGTNLGTANQTLNIGANALFRGNVNVTSDLTVGGRFNANGAVTLSQLNITGTTALGGLNVGSNMTVAGVTTLQKGLTVNDLVAVNGGLNVSGTASVNALNASNISVKTLSISGPLLISHLVSQGAAPTATAGSAVGGGGTISLSGNDTSGTLNINTGSGPAAGVLMTVVFRAAYTGTPHVVISPLTGAAGSLPVYITRTATGFQVRVDNPPPAGSVFAYDYVVMQ
ncbi:MAG TPA: hypothetical protein VLI05_05475 [Candidatus Saccharimonadia bacterium]|nr:hypothetical protein [Candidatus Saccharimonadia bacterium]